MLQTHPWKLCPLLYHVGFVKPHHTSKIWYLKLLWNGEMQSIPSHNKYTCMKYVYAFYIPPCFPTLDMFCLNSSSHKILFCTSSYALNIIAAWGYFWKDKQKNFAANCLPYLSDIFSMSYSTCKICLDLDMQIYLEDNISIYKVFSFATECISDLHCFSHNFKQFSPSSQYTW